MEKWSVRVACLAGAFRARTARSRLGSSPFRAEAKAQIAVQKTKMMKVKAAPKDGGDTAMGSSGKLKKFKGIKLKRNKTVRGIKIKYVVKAVLLTRTEGSCARVQAAGTSWCSIHEDAYAYKCIFVSVLTAAFCPLQRLCQQKKGGSPLGGGKVHEQHASFGQLEEEEEKVRGPSLSAFHARCVQSL